MTEQTSSQIAALEREAAKLRKINAALMSRVERSTDQQMNAFSLFETAIALDQQVRDRTQQLKTALQSLEKINGQLFQAKQQAEAASSLKSSILISVTHDLLQPLNAARLTLSALAEMVESQKGEALTGQIDRSLPWRTYSGPCLTSPDWMRASSSPRFGLSPSHRSSNRSSRSSHRLR